MINQDGRRIVNGEFYPVVINPFGGIGDAGVAFLSRMASAFSDGTVAATLRHVLAVSTVRMVASRLKQAIG